MSDTPQNSTRLFVANISFETTSQDLADYFQQVGEVVEVQIAHSNKRSKGYAFVTMADEESAALALKQLNRTELNGRTIRIESSTTKTHYDYNEIVYSNNNSHSQDNNQLPPPQPDPPEQQEPLPPLHSVKKGRQAMPISNVRIFICNLPESVTSADLEEAFGEYDLIGARVILKEDGTSSTFGFMEVATPDLQEKLLSEHPTYTFADGTAKLERAHIREMPEKEPKE